MNKKYYLLTAVLGLMITTLVTTAIASADQGSFPGFFGGNLTDEQKAAIQAKHEEMKRKHDELQAQMDEIINNNDFDAWQQAMADAGLDDSSVTQENFKKFKQMHALMEEGKQKFQQAHDLATEIGLPSLRGHMPKHPRGPWSGGAGSDQ